MMEFGHILSLTFLFVVNILFLLSGICLNFLVIISFWRSALLRKKLGHFMIVVLSCLDLLVVLTNHPVMATIAILWMTGEVNESLLPGLSDYCSFFVGLSLLALLVMNFERYLATYYPIFHRTSVTKRRLLSLLAILIFVALVLLLLFLNFVISYSVAAIIFFIILTPPMLFVNYKLFAIARRSRGNRRILPDTRKTTSLKNISSCLLAAACFVALSIPSLFAFGLRIKSGEKMFLKSDAYHVANWAQTICSMNGTFNCLIFYWKNTILRNEGMKVIKGIKICRR